VLPVPQFSPADIDSSNHLEYNAALRVVTAPAQRQGSTFFMPPHAGPHARLSPSGCTQHNRLRRNRQ
jgi:hypothetical protein